MKEKQEQENDYTTDGKQPIRQNSIKLLLAQLTDLLEKSGEARFLHRLHCLILARQRIPASTIAKWFSYSPSTITRWIQQFNQHGIEGLKDGEKTGRPKLLSVKQIELLKANLGTVPKRFGYDKSSWDGKCLQNHLQKQFDIELSVRQCQRLLKQLRNRFSGEAEHSDN